MTAITFLDFSLQVSLCDTCYEKVTDQMKGIKQNEELEHLLFISLLISYDLFLDITFVFEMSIIRQVLCCSHSVSFRSQTGFVS